MALINHDQVKEVRLELQKSLFTVITGQLLIKGQIDFIGAVQVSILHLGHFSTKGFEIPRNGLVNQDIPVCQEKDFFLKAGLP